MKQHSLCAVAVVVLSLLCAAVDLPMSVFVVHCEPTTATDDAWAGLLDLVALADRHAIPLSIYFTAQWAAMVLEDEEKISTVDAWLHAGHEMGCHHHPYWSTLGRPASWDGYTNTPREDLLPRDRAQHIGTMDEYMMLLTELPGERTSGCLGLGHERDLVDWPCGLLYSTHGHTVEDGMSEPESVLFGDCEVIEIGHALITSADRGELASAFAATNPEQVFGVVGHVFDYLGFPVLFEQWFVFLQSVDPEGTYRSTVSALLSAAP